MTRIADVNRLLSSIEFTRIIKPAIFVCHGPTHRLQSRTTFLFPFFVLQGQSFPWNIYTTKDVHATIKPHTLDRGIAIP